MNEKLQMLKKEYEAVDIPLQLDEIISQAFEEIPPPQKKSYRFRWWGKAGTAATAAAVLLFMVSLNTFPDLTGRLNSIPVVGEVSNFLTIREFKVADQGIESVKSAATDVTMIAEPDKTSAEPVLMDVVEDGTENINQDSGLITPAANNMQMMAYSGQIPSERAQKEETEEVLTQLEVSRQEKTYQVADIQTEPISPTVQFAPIYEEMSSTDNFWEDTTVKGEAVPYLDKPNRAKTPEEMLFITIQSDLVIAPGNEMPDSDLRTTHTHSLAQLFVDDQYIDALNIYISEEIYRRNQTAIIEGRTPIFWDFSGIKADQKYYFNPNNSIVLCFDPGEIAPVEAGAVEMMIPNEVVVNYRIPPQL